MPKASVPEKTTLRNTLGNTRLKIERQNIRVVEQYDHCASICARMGLRFRPMLRIWAIYSGVWILS